MKTEEQKPSNPSAFPYTIDAEKKTFTDMGMTLRDYFANSAINGLLSNSTFNAILPKENESIAKMCYGLADQMLKQREL